MVAAVEEGRFSIPEIARLFQVGVTFIKKMLTLHRAGEPLDPRHGGIRIKLGGKCQCGLKEIELRSQALAQTLGARAAFPDRFPH